jgi:hypothetical protein
MSAIAAFNFEDGIVTREYPAIKALRIRASISAIGSVIVIGSDLPAAYSQNAAAYYQLAFLTPGISPLRASSRKQIRHSWKRRM